MPDNYYFGSGGETFITSLAIGILVVAAILIFALPRRYVVVPLLIAGLLLPQRQNIIAFGFHFPIFRILLLIGWTRCLIRREFLSGRMNSLDKAVLWWAVCNAVTFSLLWGELAAVTNRLGFLYTSLGAYFLLRILIRDKADVVRVIKVMAIIVMTVAPLMLAEHLTGHNGFSVLGARELADVRDGSIRAQGPFGHAIIAGTFGAMLLPLFVGLWWRGERNRVLLGLGIIGSTVMTIASASSTPLMTYAAGTLALLLWRARKRMQVFRWGIVIVLAGLQLVMKAPVWFLIAHLGGAMGGTGWHRALLIDNFVRHVGEWWLIGTRNNSDWGYYMWDVDNAYVAAGVGGGLITFVLFIAILVYAYKRIGAARKMAERFPKDAHLIWAIGAALFANTVAFFGIFYFDQGILAWYALLAMASVTTKFIAPTKSLESQQDIADLSVEPPGSEKPQVLTPA
ncbi:MAG: hypothetical protein WCA13_07805 [Terriglobales bacterium]